jgi:hypothetical protein
MRLCPLITHRVVGICGYFGASCIRQLARTAPWKMISTATNLCNLAADDQNGLTLCRWLVATTKAKSKALLQSYSTRPRLADNL